MFLSPASSPAPASPPCAAAGAEWINGDQQGDLFESAVALAKVDEFSHCRR